MTCIHGGAGFGKTLAVTSCLRELEPDQDIRRITFHTRPTLRTVRQELHAALELPGQPPRYAGEFDQLLKTALAAHPRTLVLDEAQWLSGSLPRIPATTLGRERTQRQNPSSGTPGKGLLGALPAREDGSRVTAAWPALGRAARTATFPT
ncbi:ATP-binding protein (plasmid) [Embleya sp. NBC_00888]|uniref:AAA family ATPase n=1 Tax=Embleya sp. NBC_00888 TaxID=2975960 RepID=UPI002F918B7C|nr:ATP-binding protein [Embleya sp. NBC_00888]